MHIAVSLPPVVENGATLQIGLANETLRARALDLWVLDSGGRPVAASVFGVAA